MPDELIRRLSAGCAALDLSLSVTQQQQLLAYVTLLERWNKAFNLTAIRDPLAMVTQHLLDSLVVLPYLRGQTVLDIGSGAGLPGIPLAIADSTRHYTLLDSNGKKTRFLKQAVQELGLAGHVDVTKIRIEQYRPARPFDTVVSRAFAGLEEFVRLSAAACGDETVLLAMKGRLPADELNALPADMQATVVALSVPGLAAERHLVSVQHVPADCKRP